MGGEEKAAAIVGVTTLTIGWLLDLEVLSIIVTGALVWGVVWLLNSPIPKGYKAPWHLRGFFALLKVLRVWDWFKGFKYSAKELRLAWRNMKLPPQDYSYPVKMEDTKIAGVTVRVYRPNGCPTENNSAIVYHHGGGWIFGDIEMYNLFCMALSHKVQAIVVSVEYRLAPEHPYPAPLDDCVAVSRYLLEHPQEYGLDSARIAIAGDSAGGNLTAAVALRLRDLKVKPQPKIQVLIYPCLQPIDFKTPSYQINSNHPLLRPSLMADCWLLYATGEMHDTPSLVANNHTPSSLKEKFSKGRLSHDVILSKYKYDDYVPNRSDFGSQEMWAKLKPVFMDPYFAPLMAEDVSGLPEALVVTVEDDVLRDEGIWYAEYLKSSGVAVTYHNYMAGYHGLISSVVKQANNIESRNILYDFLKKKL